MLDGGAEHTVGRSVRTRPGFDALAHALGVLIQRPVSRAAGHWVFVENLGAVLAAARGYLHAYR